jgi:hypothetical protein
MTDLSLNPSGPHSDDYTRQVADGLAEAVRVLNHATQPGTGGVTTPATVSDVLGTLAAAVAGMDQLVRQLAEYLAAEHAAGRLGADSGSVADALASPTAEIANVRRAASSLHVWLARAHNITAELHQIRADG